MLRKISKFAIVSAISLALLFPATSMAANSYTVVSGDSLWKIALKTKTGVSELIEANPQLANPNLIYPGQQINVEVNAQYNQEQEVVKLVNAERAKAGLPALKHDWELARVAKYKSQDMLDKKYFSHTSPTYGSPFDMMKNFGISYKSAGENIAKGQTSAQKVVNAWMNSSGHRANIMSKDFTHIGVGYVESGHHWTQMFIKK
ncbi:SafA/ExsA family spore coat assembly protein [Virgibacillus sp. C22-A2]|uniref:SafA/ExsA family spore coat assembly protein n=1 Tax=Virgibacillus tibetensis TaxID=3042313 RepID=A0ABU6KIA7_9BACI|nr:SafA/ExsA family spore coat assembly protein [Virgibacillus sp. C22-A2]